MPELSDDDIGTIRATHDAVIRLESLIGNGDKGLCADIRRNSLAIAGLAERHNNLADKHFKLSRNFWMLVAFLVGAGILGGSIIQALIGG